MGGGQGVNEKGVMGGGMGVVTELCRFIKWAWLTGCGWWGN